MAHPQTARAADDTRFVRVAALSDVRDDSGFVVRLDDRNIVLFNHAGRVYAVDNRCPHMGFPLHKGTVKDGILTCHWHHARFDLSCGGTFDPWADDVATYPVEVRGAGEDAAVWLDPRPPRPDPSTHGRSRLQDGLKYNLRLVIAKATLELVSTRAGAADALRIGADFGIRYSSNGWGPGLTVLTCMANMLPRLRAEDRPLALFHGLTHVARECDGMPPRFPMAPLAVETADAHTLERWFREFVERRDADGAERCLHTAVAAGLEPGQVANMLFGACTDHRYRDIGHPMDFANKAFELLDHVGWDMAGLVLTSLTRRLVNSSRMEEASSWRQPVDVAEIVATEFPLLPQGLESGTTGPGGAVNLEQLAETVLGDDPSATARAMTAALRSGVAVQDLAATVTYAAARRIAQFHTRNEIGDWNTALHSYTYANAVEQAIRRAPSVALLRGVYDAAMSVYLNRFLNMPPATLPDPARTGAHPGDLLPALNMQQQVSEAAGVAAAALAGGKDEEFLSVMGQALTREDVDFHTVQCVEAAFRQFALTRGTPRARAHLIAAARYLAAHSPTPRASGQTFQIAARLSRGEALYAE